MLLKAWASRTVLNWVGLRITWKQTGTRLDMCLHLMETLFWSKYWHHFHSLTSTHLSPCITTLQPRFKCQTPKKPYEETELINLVHTQLQEQPLLAGSHTGFLTGLVPCSVHKAGNARPAWDRGGMPSLSPHPPFQLRGSGLCAPAPLSSWGHLLLSAFSGPIGKVAEGFTCVSQHPCGGGRW